MLRDSKGRFVAATTNNTTKKENNNMKREEVLVNNGINTGKYFSFTVNEAIPAGATITLSWDDVEANVAEQMETFVECKKLFRRFVMAQMFHLLNDANRYNRSFDEQVRRRHTWKYQFEVMSNEAKAMAHMEKENDLDSLREREAFWGRDKMVAIIDEYIERFANYVENLPVLESKRFGKYKTVHGQHYNLSELRKPVNELLSLEDEFTSCSKWADREKKLREFKRKFYNFDGDYNFKLKTWLDCFKGAGAYYTLVNMVLYHDCKLEDYETKELLKGEAAYEYLKSCVDEYMKYGEGWRFLAMLNRTIAINNFTFGRR